MMQGTMVDRLVGMTPVDTMHPLTHHEILGLVEPFARDGRHVDLASSDRIKRCLVFKPIDHAGEDGQQAGIREILQLDNPRSGHYRLTRNLTLPSGLKATLRIEGPQPRDLLAHIATVPPHRHFRSASGVTIAVSYRLAPASKTAGNDPPPMQMVFTGGEARIEGLNLTLNDTTVKRYPASIEIVPETGYAYELPEDLLAVLGRDWGLLRRRRAAWIGSVQARGKTLDRSRQMEGKLERLVVHLATTLTGPPSQFHETRLRARWGVALRRATPLLIFATLIAGAGSLCFVHIPDGSIMRFVTMFTPGVLMLGAFTRREIPSIEIPPLPRRSKAAAWRRPLAVHQAP